MNADPCGTGSKMLEESVSHMQILGWSQRPYRKDRLPMCLFLLSSTGQIQNNTYRAFVCITCYLGQSATYKPAGQSFPDFGVWVSVDFDLKYKILWGETRDHGGQLFMKEKKLQKKILHNYSKISTPWNIRLTQVLVEGETTLCFLADCSKQYAKMASSQQLF